MKLPNLTYRQIKDLGPCYDPIKYIPEDWEGTGLDILDIEGPSISDKFWVVLNGKFIPDELLHEFSCRCAEHVLHLYETQYPNDFRPRKAIEAKRKWMKKEITDKELDTAWDAAWAARAARVVRAARAARAAAGAASWAPTRAAWDAAWAAWDAAWAAARTARTAARAAEEQWQLDILKELLNGNA